MNYYYNLPDEIQDNINDIVVEEQLKDHKEKFQSTLNFFTDVFEKWENEYVGMVDSWYEFQLDSLTGVCGFSDTRKYYPRDYPECNHLGRLLREGQVMVLKG